MKAERTKTETVPQKLRNKIFRRIESADAKIKIMKIGWRKPFRTFVNATQTKVKGKWTVWCWSKRKLGLSQPSHHSHKQRTRMGKVCQGGGARRKIYLFQMKTRTALRLKLSSHMFILCVWRHAPTGFNGGKWRQQKQCKIWCVNWCVEGVDENMEIQGDDSGMSNTVGWDHGISMWRKLASPIEQRNSLDFLRVLSIFIGSAMKSEFSCKCCHGQGQIELHGYSQNEKLY